jgi:hypothetical protein
MDGTRNLLGIRKVSRTENYLLKRKPLSYQAEMNFFHLRTFVIQDPFSHNLNFTRPKFLKAIIYWLKKKFIPVFPFKFCKLSKTLFAFPFFPSSRGSETFFYFLTSASVYFSLANLIALQKLSLCTERRSVSMTKFASKE